MIPRPFSGKLRKLKKSGSYLRKKKKANIFREILFMSYDAAVNLLSKINFSTTPWNNNNFLS